MVEKESKEHRFKRVASKRVEKIIHYINLLGNCSNTAIYEYSEGDVKKIFSAIPEELRRVRTLFQKPKKRFKL